MQSPRDAFISRNLDSAFRKWLGKAAVLGSILIMLPAWLDLHTSTEQFTQLFLYRLATALFLLLGYHVLRKGLVQHLVPIIAVLWIALCAVLIEYSLVRSSVSETRYIIGNIVLIIVVTGFIPARFKYVFLLAFLLYGIFLVPLLIGSIGPRSAELSMVNTYVLMVLCVMLVLRYMSEKIVVHELGMKYDLEEYRNNLEDAIAERTHELAQTNEQLQRELSERKAAEHQLRHSQKLEAVGRLSGGIAHDFNNMLTAIIGYGSILKHKIDVDDPTRHIVDEILAASQRAAALTRSLLAFSRKQVLHRKPVDLPEVIDRVSKLLQRLIGEDITLVRKYAGDDLVVVADSSQLEQVLMNLATNARDAMPKGGLLAIEVSRVMLDPHYLAEHLYMKPGTYALISVSDTGTGMDRETAARIFEPFFTTKETGKGTGLGLSIVHGIIKQHEGYINVYSEPGHGTTFKIYLPLKEVTVAADIPVPAETPRRGTETIFVAEDDGTIRQLIRSILEEGGYSVIEAADGQDAVGKIRHHRESIQLLLLDVIMPKKNGKEVYDEVKNLMPGIKTVFMSGYTADIIRAQGLSHDRQEFIAKPVSPKDLLLKIRSVLDTN